MCGQLIVQYTYLLIQSSLRNRSVYIYSSYDIVAVLLLRIKLNLSL